MHYDLVELSENFKVLNNVGVLVCNKNKEQFINGHVDVPNHICLNIGRLPAWLNQLWEVGHVFLHLHTIDGHKLARHENRAWSRADACTYHHHAAFDFSKLIILLM